MSGKKEVYTLFGIPIIRKERQGLNAMQLAEWEAYNEIDPIGEWRKDFRMAELASLVTNIAIKWSAGKKQVDLTEITDFMPQWDVKAPREVKKQSIEDMKKVLFNIKNAQDKRLGKRVDDKKPPSKLKEKKDG